MNTFPYSKQSNAYDLKPYFWKFAVLLTLMFLVFQARFKGPDFPIYPAYLNSIATDGDLNLINNLTVIPPDQSCAETFRGKYVTKSYNYADFHNIGSSILWMPFYYYGQGMAILSNILLPGDSAQEQAVRIILCNLSYSTLALGFLACLLTFIIAAGYFSPGTAFWSTILIYFGTPMFFYTLLANGNANIPALFMGTLMFLFTPNGLSKKSWHPPLLLGLFFALCVAVKIDLWFQIFMLVATAIFFSLNGNLRYLNLLYIAIGYLIGDIPRLTNDYIKFGDFHSGEAGILNLRNSYHLQQLISPYHGFLTSSPVLIICLIALPTMFWMIIKKSNIRNLFLNPDQAILKIILAMSILLGSKIFIIGFRFAWGGGTFGARQLITELPLFLLLLNYLIYLNHHQENRWLKLLLPTVLVITILMNLVQAGEFLGKEPMSYFLRDQSVLKRLDHLRYLGLFITDGMMQLPLKLTSVPLFLLTVWLTWILLSRSREIIALLAPWGDFEGKLEGNENVKHIQRWVKRLTIYMMLTWLAISSANLITNQTNVESMAEHGCFNFVTVMPPSWFEMNENVASMKEMVSFYRLKGDLKEVEHIQSICKLLYPTEFYQLNK